VRFRSWEASDPPVQVVLSCYAEVKVQELSVEVLFL